MKSKSMQSLAVNTGMPFLTVLAATLLITGCVVTSVYPIYTEQDLVFEAALIGDWVSADGDAKPSEFMRFEKLDAQGYRGTAFTADQTNSVDFHLFRLGKHLFLDSCPTNRSLDSVPAHQLSKVLQLTPTLVTAGLEYRWLTDLLQQKPKALRHLTLKERDGDKVNERIVLTADTGELQKFILKHVNNTNAWQQPSELRPRRK